MFFLLLSCTSFCTARYLGCWTENNVSLKVNAITITILLPNITNDGIRVTVRFHRSTLLLLHPNVRLLTLQCGNICGMGCKHQAEYSCEYQALLSCSLSQLVFVEQRIPWGGRLIRPHFFAPHYIEFIFVSLQRCSLPHARLHWSSLLGLTAAMCQKQWLSKSRIWDAIWVWPQVQTFQQQPVFQHHVR